MNPKEKEELRKEWKKESTLTGANNPDYVADWWLSKLEAAYQEGHEKGYESANSERHYE